MAEDATAANIKLRRLNQKYKEFSNAAGLPEQRDRMKVLYPDQKSFQASATKILERSKEKYGTGLTMSANDGILSEKDVYAIDQYKKSGIAYGLNYALRSGLQLTDQQKSITNDLDQALLKLSTYRGTVYRSLTSSEMEDVQEFFEKHKPGSVVIYPAYTSTGTEIYDESMDIQMIIQSKRGCDMREYNPMELEVLFRRGSMFKVEKREGNVFWLTEL